MELHEAIEEGDIEAVKQAIADGADVNEETSNGYTPLDLAKGEPWESAETKATKKEIADLLRKHGGKSGAEDSIMLDLWIHTRIAGTTSMRKIFKISPSKLST